MRVPLVCRVCGIAFTAPRFDAKTCSSTCRSRLRRGFDLAYLNDPSLGKRERRAGYELHAAYDAAKAEHRESTIARRKAIIESRTLREMKAKQKAEQDHQRLLDQIVGAAYRKTMLTSTIKTVAAFLKLFAKEQRNDFSAEAITAVIDNPEQYPLELVRQALADLKASGDFDRILAGG